jgi:hypothetical protein
MTPTIDSKLAEYNMRYPSELSINTEWSIYVRRWVITIIRLHILALHYDQRVLLSDLEYRVQPPSLVYI